MGYPQVIYSADGAMCHTIPTWEWVKSGLPSIFMPRIAAREWVEITDVRPERLWDITPIEIAMEGVFPSTFNQDGADLASDYRSRWRELWESINGPGSWDANPYIWRYQFERIEKPEGWEA